MRPFLRKLWMTISIKRKIGIFAAMVILIMALSASFNVWITNVSLGSFGGILNDNSRCNDFQEALEQEIKAFEHYVRNADQESRDTYRVACVRTERCLWSLPSEYRRIGKERSARTWNIRNAYEGYKVYRDDVDEQKKTASFYDTSKLETRDKYAMFFNGNHGKVVITTPTEENRTLLVIKDSYANSLIPFLAPYYRKIVMVDPRYFYDDLEELMQVEEIQEVLYLYNANTFYSDTSLELALMPQSSTDSTPDSIETDNTDTASASSDNASADNPEA